MSRFGWTRPIPDPSAPNTFVSSRLNHPLALASRHHALREYYKRWLELRRTHPALGARHKELARAALDGAVLTVTRATPAGERARLVANLGAARAPWTAPPGWRLLLDSDDWAYGGAGGGGPLGPFQVLLYEPER